MCVCLGAVGWVRLQLSLTLEEHQNWIMSHKQGHQLILIKQVTTLY